MSQTNETRRAPISFAAIDPVIESTIILPTEKKVQSSNVVEWGQGNKYPDFLLSLFNNVTTLHSVIAGNIDFIVGDDVDIIPLGDRFANGIMNHHGDTIREQVKKCAKDFEIYGGFALQVIRDRAGDIAEIYNIDMRYLRSNADNDVFYYSEKWEKGGRKDVTVYPAFMRNLEWARLTDEERNSHASSILYIKNVDTQTYPAPIYAAAVKACEIERCIDNYHLNAIEHGFSSSLIVNFNNGVPDDRIKEEIENAFEEKFTGHQNAGRVMFSWNPNKASATTLETPKIEDFGDRYTALSKHSRQQIFTAFRANPNLFGIPTDGNGFSNEEYEESFRLYNRTQIRPIQRLIADAYDKLYGASGVLTIKPFSLDGNAEKEVN